MPFTSHVNLIFYDKWAQNYDSDENSTIHMDELYFASFLNEISQKKCIEIGCGTGRNTQKLVANCNKVLAMDLSHGMLDIARSKIQSKSVDFLHANFLEHDFGARKFDVAIVSLVLEHIENLELAFDKIASLLAKGGRLLISEIHPYRMQNGSGARFKDEEGNEMRAASFPHKENDFENAAKNAGFDIIRKTICFGDESLKEINANWEKYAEIPMNLIYDFKKRG